MNEEIVSDKRKLAMLKKYINQSDELRKNLPNIYYCGIRVVKQPAIQPAVLILKNEQTEKAKLFGNTSCHSAWACPSCTAQVMAKKGTDIACAIDALAKKYNQLAIMLTFTMPHKVYMSCKESFNVLLESWRMFARSGNRRGHTYKCGGKRTKETIRTKGQDPYGLFRQTLGITHSIKVYEFTWSPKNGWHPHIHVLYFVPKENFDKLDEWEDKLSKRWWHCLKKYSVKVLNKMYPEQKSLNQLQVDNLYTDWREHPLTGHKCVYFSKDDKGKTRQIKSSLYISGWTGDSELTNIKQKLGRGIQLTPFQMLDKAQQEPENKNRWLHLFTEYAQATYKHRRCEFSSRSGITKIIAEWKKTKEYIETFKKKVLDKAQGTWEMAYWFNEQQWSKICWLELTTNKAVIAEILSKCFIKQDLEKFLIELGIPLTTKPYRHQNFMQEILNKKSNAA